MVIWVNGPFGVGKTTIANQLCGRHPHLRLFDPEIVGYMLQAQLRGVEFDDFQDLPAWRKLVPRVMSEVAAQTGQHPVAVQTVLNEQYWTEMQAGLVEENLAVTHVLLDCSPEVLARRIDADAAERDARQWRRDHIEPFIGARGWLSDAADVVIDTSSLTPDSVVDALLEGLDAPR